MKRFYINFTDEQWQIIATLAASQGLSETEYIRWCIAQQSETFPESPGRGRPLGKKKGTADK